MNVHLFGNGSSPAVTTYGLCRTAIDGEEEYGEEAKKFICRNFYVDGGLNSLLSTQGATDLVKSAQATLATANLRFHEVVSNSVEVMEAFLAEDRAKDVRDLDLCHDSLPAQRSLGVSWDLVSRSEAVNYTSVSLTSVPCKLLEHIIYRSIMIHLNSFDILVDAQHGFRPGRSCEM